MNWAIRQRELQIQAGEEPRPADFEATFKKVGTIEFWMNDQPARVKRYKTPSERSKMIKDWLNEIRNISDVNTFHYVIKPQL